MVTQFCLLKMCCKILIFHSLFTNPITFSQCFKDFPHVSPAWFRLIGTGYGAHRQARHPEHFGRGASFFWGEHR